jgi:hypothetical protein
MKYIFVESTFAEGCVCLTRGYSQFTACVSSSKTVFLFAMYLNLPPVLPVFNKTPSKPHKLNVVLNIFT